MRKFLGICVFFVCVTVTAFAFQLRDDHDDRGPIQVGYAVITPTSGSATGLVAFETFGFRVGSIGGATQAGVLPTGLTTNAMIFVDRSARLIRNGGVAIVNPNSTDANVTLRLLNSNGAQIATTTLVVAARNQVAKFATELFQGASLPADFTGTLWISSGTVPISITGLRFRGFNFSALPATSLSGTSLPVPVIATGVGGAGSILLPQFAAGGGWSTSLVIGNTGTGSLTVRVDLFKSDGTPLTARLNHQSASSFTNLVISANGVVKLSPLDTNGDDDF